MSAARQNQQAIIKADLIAGKTVDPVSAFPKGITRLSSIIHRLKRQGLPIITEQDKGNGLARYSLPENWRGGDAEQSLPECCENRPSGLTSETASTLKRPHPHKPEQLTIKKPQ